MVGPKWSNFQPFRFKIWLHMTSWYFHLENRKDKFGANLCPKYLFFPQIVFPQFLFIFYYFIFIYFLIFYYYTENPNPLGTECFRFVVVQKQFLSISVLLRFTIQGIVCFIITIYNFVTNLYLTVFVGGHPLITSS